MKASIDSIAAAPAFSRARTADFLELTKPRITLLVLATTLVGFYLGTGPAVSLFLLAHTLVGTALVAGGASALNMYLERSADSRMQRTLRRPLPAGRLRSGEALAFAIILSLAGLAYLFLLVNSLSSLLAAITLLCYLFLYTPLKSRTWLCTMVGAIPGAVPPMIGWAAADAGLRVGAWVLFAIVFLWQLPHFYAIGWMYREDYARGGFAILPVIDGSGSRTSRQVTTYVLGLLLVSAIPWWIGLAGFIYFVGAVCLGLSFLFFALLFARLRDRISARRLFVVSVCYLPALLALLMVDKIKP